MDLIFKRYSSPYLLLDEVIQQRRLDEFIHEIYSIKNEEDMFDIWLHKVFDKTFNEFKGHVDETNASNSSNKTTLEAAIKNSRSMLKGFVPS